MLKEKKYTCQFCSRKFVRKKWFDRHTCTQRERFLARNNIDIIRAHRFFVHWQTRSGLIRGGKTKDFEAFARSPYYNTFVKLSEFVKTNYVVSGYMYVDWLVENNVPEREWFREDKLDTYHAYVRASQDPSTQAETTVKNISAWCSHNGVKKIDFFKSVTPGQALNMVRENKLSPWVLLGYEPCIEDLTARFHGEVFHALKDHINLEYWLEKTGEDQDGCTLVSQIMDTGLDAT